MIIDVKIRYNLTYKLTIYSEIFENIYYRFCESSSLILTLTDRMICLLIAQRSFVSIEVSISISKLMCKTANLLNVVITDGNILASFSHLYKVLRVLEEQQSRHISVPPIKWKTFYYFGEFAAKYSSGNKIILIEI